ncbi:hypothetical protein AWZ03_003573 [Drosophila navojoa]|uniref:Uncharacterized protein n=1 Tax=Drosophila navojoa TaxID=7232 RepID=A0A484BMR8_DRONA|nr:hypothetical protein AWZ03_003573 [Drosophila navojoa]
MIDLEDLPRMQSLSPIQDIEEYRPKLTQLNPKVFKALKPGEVMPKLLIKPTVVTTPAKLPLTTTLTTPMTTMETPPTPVASLKTPTTQKNSSHYGFNYNLLHKHKQQSFLQPKSELKFVEKK